eukprot:12449880-Alexandrium_andersonii.AAC.1
MRPSRVDFDAALWPTQLKVRMREGMLHDLGSRAPIAKDSTDCGLENCGAMAWRQVLFSAVGIGGSRRLL